MDQITQDLKQQFTDFEAQLNGEKAMPTHVHRQTAISALTSSGLPHRKDEEWKYTPMTSQFEKNFDVKNLAKSNASQFDKKEYEIGAENTLNCFFDGVDWHLEASSKTDIAQIMSFRAADEAKFQPYQEHFNKIINRYDNPFIRMNTAFLKEGLLIHVPKGKAETQTIVLHHVADTSKGQVINQPRILVVAEEASEVKVVELFHHKGNDKSFTNSCTEIFVGKSAIVSHYTMQQSKGAVFQTSEFAVHQEEKSVFNAFCITTEGEMIRNNLDIHLNGSYIESNMFGAYVLEGESHVDNHTTVNHAFPHCESNELYKGILNDKSTGVFNGKIFVRQDAQKTNAFQSNMNILLSDDAKIHTKPQLEIWADDVKCSHGATTGQLDEDQLFYLRARGIGKTEAISMLTRAFASEVTDKIQLPFLKEMAENALDQRFLK